MSRPFAALWRMGGRVQALVRLDRLRKKACFWMTGPKGIPQGLKPTLIRLALYRG